MTLRVGQPSALYTLYFIKCKKIQIHHKKVLCETETDKLTKFGYWSLKKKEHDRRKQTRNN